MQFTPRQIIMNHNVVNSRTPATPKVDVSAKKPATPVKALVPYADDDEDSDPAEVPCHKEPTSRGSSTSSTDSLKENKDIAVAVKSPKRSVAAAFLELMQPSLSSSVSPAKTEFPSAQAGSSPCPEPIPTVSEAALHRRPVASDSTSRISSPSKKAARKMKRREMLAERNIGGSGLSGESPSSGPPSKADSTEEEKKKKRKRKSRKSKRKRDGSPVPAMWVEKEATIKGLCRALID